MTSTAPSRRRRGRTSEPVSYDFRRPIQLSREHSRTLQLAFDGFARQATTVFTSVTRSVCAATLVDIEQRSYAEYVESLGSQTYMTIFRAEPIPGACVLEMPMWAIFSCIDHMLGGPGGPSQPDRPLTEIESNVARGLIDRLLGELPYYLNSIVVVEPTFERLEYNPQFAQVAATADVMVVITFDLRINEHEARMTMCLPFSGLSTHLTNAVQPGAVSDRERAQRAAASRTLHERFDDVPVDVAIRFTSSNLGPAELSSLRPGDVLRLDHLTSAPLDVTVAGNTFAHATAGARGTKLAALIVSAPRDPRKESL